MEVTVVVATRNRQELLESTLGCLSTQDFKGEWETVVVDDGSTIPSTVPASTRLIRHERPKGLRAAWKTGYEAAEGGMVLFLTDNDVPSKRWLRKFVSGAEKNPSALVFRG